MVWVSGWRYKQLMSVKHWKAQYQETVKGFIIPPYAVYMYKYIQSCTKVKIPCVLLSCMTCDITLRTLFKWSFYQTFCIYDIIIMTIDKYLMPRWIYGHLLHICLPQGEGSLIYSSPSASFSLNGCYCLSRPRLRVYGQRVLIILYIPRLWLATTKKLWLWILKASQSRAECVSSVWWCRNLCSWRFHW